MLLFCPTSDVSTELAQLFSPVSTGERVTSGFLSISDSDCRVPAELGQESQASSCVEAWPLNPLLPAFS